MAASQCYRQYTHTQKEKILSCDAQFDRCLPIAINHSNFCILFGKMKSKLSWVCFEKIVHPDIEKVEPRTTNESM